MVYEKIPLWKFNVYLKFELLRSKRPMASQDQCRKGNLHFEVGITSEFAEWSINLEINGEFYILNNIGIMIETGKQ